ncbi:MAG TPA: asparagine synthase C-terminal domain-containing protein, partial [Bacteroidia bacterium]|nr:asparagine synthase C-terminal domain-containing protein [Bacteroidia bacterium]
NTFVVSKATKNAGITMALSGLGGDELFAGYDVFRRISKLEKSKLMSAPLFIRKMAAGFIRTAKRNVAGDKMALLLEQKHVGFDNAYPVSRQIFLNEQMFSLFSDGYHPVTAVWDAARNASKKAPGKDQLISRISIAEIETYMQNVLLRDTDQMSMAHALEVRVPFLDYKLVEYVLSLPDEMKFPSTPKKLLVDSLGDLLPREIVDRPKMGFTFPWKHWMKNELKNFCEERLKDLGKREQFDPKGIDELWNKFLKDDPRVTWSRIWPLVVLSHWLGKNHIND